MSPVNISMPTVKGSDAGRGVVRHQKNALVEEEDGRAPLNQQVTIGTIPDNALLEIFELYLDGSCHRAEWFVYHHAEWFPLAHVCHRWRCILSASPRRLSLQLVCTGYTPPGEMLCGWPTVPIIIHAVEPMPRSRSGINNIVAALKHNNRVSKIKFHVESWQLNRFLPEMQEPFPMLDYLDIRTNSESYPSPPVLLDSFLGGSAPLLIYLGMEGIQFSGLPKLLFSANNFVNIHLWNIPHSEYISPEAIAAGLSEMKHLLSLDIGISSPPSRRARQRPQHPVIRIVLPALFWLRLECSGDYLEDLVARMDVPSLKRMDMSFLPPPVSDLSELPQFISCIKAFEISDQAHMSTNTDEIRFKFSQTIKTIDHEDLLLVFAKSGSYSSLLSSCVSSLPRHYFERLEIHEHREWWYLREVETGWEGLSPRFATVKNLFLNERATGTVGHGLKASFEERGAEVFPALENIFLEGPWSYSWDAFRIFSTVRRSAGLPVSLHYWEVGK